jgi:hypothetical protein
MSGYDPKRTFGPDADSTWVIRSFLFGQHPYLPFVTLPEFCWRVGRSAQRINSPLTIV